MGRQPNVTSCPGEPAVQRPKPAAGEKGGSEKVCIDPAEASPPEPAIVHETQDFVVSGWHGGRQGVEIAEQARSISQISASELAGDKGMHQNRRLGQEFGKHRLAVAQVLDPNGCVN